MVKRVLYLNGAQQEIMQVTVIDGVQEVKHVLKMEHVLGVYFSH